MEFAYDCKPLFDVPEGQSNIGRLSSNDGRYQCGGPPGNYQIEVYSKEGKGVIGTKQVEIEANETVIIDVTVQP